MKNKTAPSLPPAVFSKADQLEMNRLISERHERTKIGTGPYTFTPEEKHFPASVFYEGKPLFDLSNEGGNGGKRRANVRAAFIVHACNTSAANEAKIAALVEAGEGLKEWAAQMGGWEAPAWRKLNSALVKAKTSLATLPGQFKTAKVNHVGQQSPFGSPTARSRTTGAGFLVNA